MRFAMFLIPFALLGCAAREQGLPTAGKALLGVSGFYAAVCTEPLPEHAKVCADVRPQLNTVIDWYTILNDTAEAAQ